MDLTRKYQYLVGGHLAEPPLSMTYASMISRYIILIKFIITALSDLKIMAGDIQNSYLKVPTKEKVLLYAGDECKPDQRREVIIARYLYGLKYIALAWRNHL